MPRKRFTNEQIAFALRQAENGATVDEVCRKMGVSEPTFYRWKKQFVGMGVPEIRRLKQLEDENSKLKRLVAPLAVRSPATCRRPTASASVGPARPPASVVRRSATGSARTLK
ncbi:MAG: Transposase family [Methylobacterium brachiatum]|nr:Transposase family [Methylobacterium brachiatum]